MATTMTESSAMAAQNPLFALSDAEITERISRNNHAIWRFGAAKGTKAYEDIELESYTLMRILEGRKFERDEEAAAKRVAHLKRVNPHGLEQMSRVLEIAGGTCDEPDQYEGWSRALMGHDRAAATLLFDAAMNFLGREHLLQKEAAPAPAAPPAQDKAEAKRSKMMAAAEERMKRKR